MMLEYLSLNVFDMKGIVVFAFLILIILYFKSPLRHTFNLIRVFYMTFPQFYYVHEQMNLI